MCREEGGGRRGDMEREQTMECFAGVSSAISVRGSFKSFTSRLSTHFENAFHNQYSSFYIKCICLSFSKMRNQIRGEESIFKTSLKREVECSSLNIFKGKFF